MELPELTKRYYAIGEVADMFNIASSVIRYWETEFPHLHPAKNTKGDRKYTAKDIIALEEIYHLVKERGFTIDGARKELKLIKNEQKTSETLLKNLLELRKKAVKMRDGL